MKNLTLPILLLVGLIVSGCKGINIPGVSGPNLYTTDDHAVIDLVVEKLNLDGGLEVEIPKLTNSFLAIEGQDGGGTQVAFKFDIETISNGNVGTLEPKTLPGGREIPIIGGELPGVAFNVPNFKNVHVYVGRKVYGFFLPVKFPADLGGTLTYTVKIKGKKYGRAAAVGNDDNGENSGVLVLIDLNTLDRKTLRKIRKFQKSFGKIPL